MSRLKTAERKKRTPKRPAGKLALVGSVAANPHEGSRSEYLAQYAFASFGTSVAVPHQEDSGIDLYCALTERIGQRLWPRAHYTVQVKSTAEPWIFDSEDSVRWLVHHPLPLFLCVVDKSSLRLRLYHTGPRFYAWSLPPLPTRLELTPGEGSEGYCTQWSEGNRFLLSAPIVEASIAELLDDQTHTQVGEILAFWIECERENLDRIRAGVHSFRMPYRYVTNSTAITDWMIHGITHAPHLRPALEQILTSLSWLTEQLYAHDDLAGAARGAILLRHLFPKADKVEHYPAEVSSVQIWLNTVLGEQGYLFAGVDSLASLIDDRIKRGVKVG